MLRSRPKCMLMFLVLLAAIFLITGAWTSVAAKVITLKFAANTPTTHPNYKYYMTFFDKVVKDSNGQVEFKYFWGKSLLKGSEMAEGVGTGTVDMGEIQSNWDVKLEPTLKIVFLPFLWDNHFHLQRAADARLKEYAAGLYKKHNVKLLNYCSSGAQNWWHRTKFFKTPADFKGENMRGLGGYVSEAMKLMGASVMSIGTFEVLTALQRGMVDGVGTAAPSLPTYGWEKYCKYGTFADWAQTPRGFGINIGVWNRLPKKIQNIIAKAAEEFEDYHYKVLAKDDYEVYFNNWTRRGFKGYKLTPAEKKVFKQALKPLYDKAVKQYGGVAKWHLDLAKKTSKE